MVRVLVTGGGGYVGSTICEMLLDKGYGVVCLDRFFFGREFIKDMEDRMSVVEADIRSFDPSILNGVDVVIDLAALSMEAFEDEFDDQRIAINHKGRVRVAQLAKKHGAKRYLLASTCSVYGFQDEVVNEESKINPLTVYARSSALAESDTHALSGKDFCTSSLRQSTIYGLSRKMRFDLAINSMTLTTFMDNKILIGGDGTQRRAFVHVRDSSAAFIKIMETDPDIVNKQTYNVGSNDQNFSMLELSEKIPKILNKSVAYEYIGKKDARSYVADFSKIKGIGVNAKYDLTYGVRELYKALEDKEIDGNDPRTLTKKCTST